ncbi:sulfatase [Jiangella asiatica]|uniref:Sulfatase N-terminal domain-containing protein n=1 Tax=Jiangella asiatica TaxID=2530372 RepID=A0A4R5DQ42_9ACTN|nr:sulfatase-like hydrolase/transferase [Jiangella asiatica]TDE14300.1 hypothetical protein E1269_03855 [Jiangella asiatica]
MRRPPSILLIVCDQLNASVMGTYGGPVSTPNIDRLARSGVTFTEATCPAVLCSPSRASLITGVYPHTHGILHNVGRRDYPTMPSPPTEEGIKASDVTTEKLLDEHGYATHHYGKWHLSDEDLPYYSDTFGEHQTYAAQMEDVFRRVRERPRAEWMDWYGWAMPVLTDPAMAGVHDRMSQDGTKSMFGDFVAKIGRLELPVEETFDHMVASRTVERIQRSGPEPFMITCSFNSPHDPNIVPSPYYELYDPADIGLPTSTGEARFSGDPSHHLAAALGENGLREFLRVYYASVRLMDDQVGRVLDTLESSGRRDDTVVVFLADHGDMAAEHGMIWKSTSAFYDEIVRIPLIVSYPRATAGPLVDSSAASLVDIMPTLLDFAGVPVPSHVEGRSLVERISGTGSSRSEETYSYCERLPANTMHRRRLTTEAAEGSFMIRSPEWKYARYPDGDEYLYDLADDPGENVNLAHDPEFKTKQAQLAHELDAWLARSWPQ